MRAGQRVELSVSDMGLLALMNENLHEEDSGVSVEELGSLPQDS